ncbi:MAG: hypothetical protein V1904_14405 [Bacteroidota bacterium]
MKFDSSAVYETSDSLNQCDINKLYGFTDCGSAIHENSARFGWRWMKGQLELHAYCYSDGIVRKQLLTNVKIGEEIYCMIKISQSSYFFQVNELPVDTIPRGCSCDSLSKFRCFPYFGGTETAPHDIKIKIKDQ